MAGLPEGISSAPTPRQSATTAIGQRLGPYDLVHVEEDFNYHAALYAADNHAYRTPTSGGAGVGSGLNSLSSLPYDGDDFERVHWNSCQLDSGDCLTPKGFTFMRTRLAEGVYVDVYNLHTNAGTNDGDESSRASNLAQLSGFIQSHSAGNAVIVMGDTNTRYTRPPTPSPVSGPQRPHRRVGAAGPGRQRSGGGQPGAGVRRAGRHQRLRGRGQGPLPRQQARQPQRHVLQQRAREVPGRLGQDAVRPRPDHREVQLDAQSGAAAVRAVRRPARRLLH